MAERNALSSCIYRQTDPRICSSLAERWERTKRFSKGEVPFPSYMVPRRKCFSVPLARWECQCSPRRRLQPLSPERQLQFGNGQALWGVVHGTQVPSEQLRPLKYLMFSSQIGCCCSSILKTSLRGWFSKCERHLEPSWLRANACAPPQT